MPQSHHSDVIGSLLRPRYLTRGRDDYAAGQLTTPEFKRIEDRAVDAAIAMQESIGLDVVTDGEFRRFSFLDQVVSEVEGVEAIEPIDIRMAKDLGYRIKLVASAVKSAEGVTVSVHPALAPLAHPLAQAGGPLNALFIEGKRIGRIFIQGPGAGAGPTAAAVAADIADVMTRARRPVFQAPAGRLKPFAPVDAKRQLGRAYVRLLVRDEPGVIAAITETLAESGVSIDSFLQRPVEDAGGVPIVLTTHAVPEGTLLEALKRMQKLKALIGPPRMIRIARI